MNSRHRFAANIRLNKVLILSELAAKARVAAEDSDAALLERRVAWREVAESLEETARWIVHR